MTRSDGYLLDNQQNEAGERFDAFATLFDPTTFRHLEGSMVKALRPGGRLLIEDADPALQPLVCPDEHGPEQELANRLRHGFRHLLADRGADLAYGRRLPRLLREAGLRQVEADAYFPLTSPACAALESATIRQIRDRLVSAKIATNEDVDRHLANIASGAMDLATAPMISAWGRKA
ncbi:hypothetical protein [Streptomyces sp. NBC_01396]|uniref:hypothetical protein n=1 Tax=Streptomyces sp. NBC_01396 TaxID=2903852 RepID=UPI00324660AF